jgi:hypothetical protein
MSEITLENIGLMKKVKSAVGYAENNKDETKDKRETEKTVMKTIFYKQP